MVVTTCYPCAQSVARVGAAVWTVVVGVASWACCCCLDKTSTIRLCGQLVTVDVLLNCSALTIVRARLFHAPYIHSPGSGQHKK